MGVNDRALWDAIYEKENFKPGWAWPGTDPNLVRLVSEHVAGLGSGTPVRILDVGCGNGRNSMVCEALAGLQVRYTGVDFSEKAVAHCRSAYGPEKTFITADLTAPGFPAEGPFDVIFDCGCFHAIPPDHRGTYKRHLASVSGPGTLVVIAGWDRPDSLEFSDKPAYLPYLFLHEWGFNAGDMARLFAPEFEVLDHRVDEEIYRNVGVGFGYTRLRPSTAHI